MKTIAVINLGPIGDVINASPVCIEIKKNYPDSRLIFVAAPISEAAAKCLPGVDKVVTFDRYYKDKGIKVLKSALPLIFTERIDVAFLLTDNLRSALFAFFAGARKIVGRNCDGRGIFLTHKMPFLDDEKNMEIHVSEQYMRVLKPLNLYNPDYIFGFDYSRDDELYIKNLIADTNYANTELIGFCPCSSREFKDWKPEEGAKFINFVNQNTHYKIVIVGQENASDYAQKLKALGVDDFLDLSCKTTIPQLAALIDIFKKFVSVDSAPMHIAFSLEIPTLALFFQPNYKKWGPYDLQKHKLMFDWSNIPAERVCDEFASFISGGSRHFYMVDDSDLTLP